ncbi:MAG TPA: endonuclease Q family protein [Clostridia bacterium]|nr:endonuclease Q family protein [Clostridia bacterium]
MKMYFVDLHVHVGRSSGGKEVKKATASDLTFENIAFEAYHRKGINVIGVVDCASPYIIEDIEVLLDRGEITEKTEGGMNYGKGMTLILGAEIETHEAAGCSAHSLCFFPDLRRLKAFSGELSRHVKNIRSCCYMSRLAGQELFNLVDCLGGVYIPAHVFSPHKSFYGNCCRSLHEIFNEEAYARIPAIELGLSADAEMASMLSELDGKSFISNSDAHSLGKMGREYNIFEMKEPNFRELVMALKGEAGRGVRANYGLNPRLGKYHRSFCLACDAVIEGAPPVLRCPVSEKHPVVVGVRDRIEEIKDRESPETTGRAPYHYQVPLEFLPKVGPKTIGRLIDYFGSEMNILHKASLEELKKVVKGEIAENIILAREGRIGIDAGGGGIYGRVEV